MKRRTIYTKIWQDEWFSDLSRDGRLFFIYLLTNSQINLCGIYELSDRLICYDLGFNKTELETLKKELEPKVFFEKGYIGIYNIDKYDDFMGGKLLVAKEKQLKEIPQNVLTSFEKAKNTPSLPHRYPINTPSILSDTPNSNSNSNSNSNRELVLVNKQIKEKSEKKELIKTNFSKISDLTKEDLQLIADRYSVPLSFVLSKLDDMTLWAEARPNNTKLKGRNWKMTLMAWVKRDAIELKTRAIGDPSKRGVDARHIK